MLVLAYFLGIKTFGLPESSFIQDSDLGSPFSLFEAAASALLFNVKTPAMKKQRLRSPQDQRKRSWALAKVTQILWASVNHLFKRANRYIIFKVSFISKILGFYRGNVITVKSVVAKELRQLRKG